MGKLSITVEQGTDIHVDHVEVMRATPDVIWLSANTREKYPDVDCLGKDETPIRGRLAVTTHVFICRSRFSASDTKDLSMTKVSVHGLDESWHIAGTSTGRYTVQIALVRESRRRREGVRLADWHNLSQD